MYTDPYTDEPIDFDEPLYTLLVLRDWTNQVVGRLNDIPRSGIDWASEHLLFNAWDHADGPQTWTVVAVPADWQQREPNHADPHTQPLVTHRWRCADGSIGQRKTRHSTTSRMLRYARFVGQHIAQPDGAPTPIGAPVGYPDAPNYDILTSDDMVPWESDVVGELGSGPGVAA